MGKFPLVLHHHLCPIFLHQVDKIVDQLQQLMQVYDLAALRDYWSYLERRLFSRLEDIYRPTINKLKTSLFRFYLVYTIQVLVSSGNSLETVL